MFKILQKFVDYIKGLSIILYEDRARYSFVLKKIDIVYNGRKISAEAIYMPIGSFRPFKQYISCLNEPTILNKFKLDHARIIIGISTLEVCLDFSNKEHYEIYLNFIKSCQKSLENEDKK